MRMILEYDFSCKGHFIIKQIRKKCMRTGMPIIVIGTSMFVLGLILFYSIQIGQTDPVLRFIKNSGTFMGLSGMGVTLAGIIIFLINRNAQPIQENFETEYKE
mgnify:CR=1 FL=1|jgi:hypothetical protein